MTSREMFEAQKERDRKHHADRLAWLSAERPPYGDGTPVAAVDVMNGREVSAACLADPSGMRGYNTGPQEGEE